MTIDYLTFSLKPDQQAYNKRDVDLSFIVDFLKLGSEWLNFENREGRNGYPFCYEYNDVLLLKLRGGKACPRRCRFFLLRGVLACIMIWLL